MNRTELQRLSSERAKDAQVLLAAMQWSGAYYSGRLLAGMRLKSCILARIERTGIIFEDKKFAEHAGHMTSTIS